jgi:hypothetical protein
MVHRVQGSCDLRLCSGVRNGYYPGTSTDVLLLQVVESDFPELQVIILIVADIVDTPGECGRSEECEESGDGVRSVRLRWAYLGRHDCT